MRVLIVEDDLCTQYILTWLAEESVPAGSIAAVSTLAEALHTVSDGKETIIILDLNLPDSSAEETLDHIPGLVQRGMPVIVVTAADDPSYRTLAEKAGACDFLFKSNYHEFETAMGRAIRALGPLSC